MRKKSLMTEHHGLEILLLKVKVTCLHEATKKEMTYMKMSVFYMQHQNVLWVCRLGLEKNLKREKQQKTFLFPKCHGHIANTVSMRVVALHKCQKKPNPKPHISPTLVCITCTLCSPRTMSSPVWNWCNRQGCHPQIRGNNGAFLRLPLNMSLWEQHNQPCVTTS